MEKVLEGDPLNALEEKANATLEPNLHQQSDVTLVPVHSESWTMESGTNRKLI